MSHKRHVFISRKIPVVANELLEGAGFAVSQWNHPHPMPADQLQQAIEHCEALLCTSSDRIDAAFLRRNTHLKVISTFAVGFDNIDTVSAGEVGIPIGHTPGVLTEATADIAFALMLAASRKLSYLFSLVKENRWKSFGPTAYLGQELRGKTLGIFGMGAIGTEMARLSRAAFGMKIIYHNRRPRPDLEPSLQATYVGFDGLLEQSDVLSIHASLNESTRQIFNAEVFQKMKSSSIVINTARGGLIEEKALVAALQQGTIWGAGLDVTDPEPMHGDSPLLEMENVAISPHIGSATIRARDGMSTLAARNIISFFETGEVIHRARSRK